MCENIGKFGVDVFLFFEIGLKLSRDTVGLLRCDLNLWVTLLVCLTILRFLFVSKLVLFLCVFLLRS